MKTKSHGRSGEVLIQFNTQNEAILSPDKSLKLLPCEKCGELHWKELNVVSFLCPPCFKLFKEENGGIMDSNVMYQAGYAYACGYHD